MSVAITMKITINDISYMKIRLAVKFCVGYNL
jgi:hypothetical protein